MSKLLSTEFCKLRGKFIAIFIITIVFAVVGVLCSMSIEGTFYFGLNMYATVLGPIFCGMTGISISQDFANNTIRNKFIVGHTRFNIYLSYQIVFAVLAFLMTAVFIGAYILSGKIFSDMESFQIDQPTPDMLKIYRENFFKALPVYFIAVPSLTTLGVFISMTLKNGLGGVLTMILLFALFFLSNTYEIFSENKFIRYVNQILPSSQIYLMGMFSDEPNFSPVKYILLSTAFAVVMITFGYAIFRKADLK